eukprot:Skav207003  [mRNA]  locus=scaffold3472:136026:143430:- [translate_table: standard]
MTIWHPQHDRNPFLSLEKSDQFDDKMRNMRQLKSGAPGGTRQRPRDRKRNGGK